MTFREKENILGSIHFYIKNRNTGTLKELSKKVNINRSTAHRYIEIIRSYGAVIYFDRSLKSYCYSALIEVNHNQTFTIKERIA